MMPDTAEMIEMTEMRDGRLRRQKRSNVMMMMTSFSEVRNTFHVFFLPPSVNLSTHTNYAFFHRCYVERMLNWLFCLFLSLRCVIDKRNIT